MKPGNIRDFMAHPEIDGALVGGASLDPEDFALIVEVPLKEPSMKKLLYVCLDGLGDDPIPEFDGRTPLEAAPTPALDSLAARGRTGIVVTVGDGIAPESDIAVFAILGYDPREEHPGRGVVEAVGHRHGLPRRRPGLPRELRHLRVAGDRRPARREGPLVGRVAQPWLRRSTIASSCPARRSP